MKYLLINQQTGEETFCDKVTIDGFDYYVSNEIQLGANNVWVATKSRVFKFELHMAVIKSNMPRLILATNNPDIDIPKVMNNYKTSEWLAADLYGYDKNCKLPVNDIEVNSFIEGYNKSQETHPFSEEDMKSFGTHFYTRRLQGIEETIDQSFQIWKSQQPKTVYYA